MFPTKFRFIWPSGFRGEDFFKLANQKQELPVATMFVNGSGQNEQSLQRTFHRCFLPSFSSFGWGVSEEKIKMWKVNGRQELTPLARWAKKKRIYKKNYDAILVKIRFGRKKDTKLCLPYTCWKMESVGITSFFNFYTKLAIRFEHIFFINKQFCTCTNAFPNEFTVRSYEYCTGQHWILYWM